MFIDQANGYPIEIEEQINFNQGGVFTMPDNPEFSEDGNNSIPEDQVFDFNDPYYTNRQENIASQRQTTSNRGYP